MPKVATPTVRLYGPLAAGFGSRVEQAALRVGGRPAAAEAMGLSSDQLSKIIGEKAVPNFASIAALARRTGCRLDWLAFDEGDGFGAEPSTRKFFSEGEAEIVWIQRIDNQGAFPFEREWLARTLANIRVDALAALTGSGSAMEPTIGRDDLVLVDTDAKRIVDGEIFVFDFGDGRFVRRTQRAPDGSLILVADNPQYGPQRLSAEQAEVTIVSGQVVWAGGRV